jgi:rhodanese-related sulfurtransferase
MTVSVPHVDVASVEIPLPEGWAVLDVREDSEWAQGHIEGAVHVPLMQLPARLAEVPGERTLVVCRVGARSFQAAAFLLAHGKDAVNLAGGMLEWEAAGRAMVSETDRPPRII